MNIKQHTVSGELYPDFLVEHIEREWSAVALNSLDPDICLKVDSALEFCGCAEPSNKLRQFLYLYHDSVDFDYQTLAQLVKIFSLAGEEQVIWDNLLSLEFQRDCGMGRDEYFAELVAIASALDIEEDNGWVHDLLLA